MAKQEVPREDRSGGIPGTDVTATPYRTNPVLSAVQFAHLTNHEGGASVNVHTNKLFAPGDKVHFVGAEPDIQGNRIPTHVHGKTEIDASGGYEHLSEAMAHMKARNEKALWSMETMTEVTNPDYVEEQGQRDRISVSDRSELSPVDVAKHMRRVRSAGGTGNKGMTLGSWREG